MKALKDPAWWKYRWISFYLPLYLLWFVLLERNIVLNYTAIYMPLDDKIPFLEGFVIPYVLWYPFMILPGFYWLIKYPKDLSRYMWSVAVGFSLSMLICMIFPSGQDLRPAVLPRDNFFTRMVEHLYAIDTNTNVLPSVHVVGAGLVAMAACHCEALSGKKGIWTKILTIALAAVISVSILFVKQHSVWDLIAGVAVCVPAYWLVYRDGYKLFLPKRFRNNGAADEPQ